MNTFHTCPTRHSCVQWQTQQNISQVPTWHCRAQWQQAFCQYRVGTFDIVCIDLATPFWPSVFHPCHFGLIRLTSKKKKRDQMSPITLLLLYSPRKKNSRVSWFYRGIPWRALHPMHPTARSIDPLLFHAHCIPVWSMPRTTGALKKKRKRDDRSPIKLLLPPLGTLVRFTPQKKKKKKQKGKGRPLLRAPDSCSQLFLRLCLPDSWPTALPIRRPAYPAHHHSLDNMPCLAFLPLKPEHTLGDEGLVSPTRRTIQEILNEKASADST